MRLGFKDVLHLHFLLLLFQSFSLLVFDNDTYYSFSCKTNHRGAKELIIMNITTIHQCNNLLALWISHPLESWWLKVLCSMLNEKHLRCSNLLNCKRTRSLGFHIIKPCISLNMWHRFSLVSICGWMMDSSFSNWNRKKKLHSWHID